MHKRGQVTVFIILGILIVVVLGVIFYLYNLRVIPPIEPQQEFDFSRTETIKNYVEGCINTAGNEALNLVGKQGGEISPGFYQNWNCIEPGNCDKVSYLCYTTEYAACYNKKPFLLSYVQNEVNTYVQRKITTCINELDGIARGKGYTLQKGSLALTTTINPYSTIISLDYPITITSGTGAQVQQSKFVKNFNVPLGRLIKVAEDIVNMEIASPQGEIFYDGYIIRSYGEINIERRTYGNTEIYITKVMDSPYKFQFAIQNYIKPFP